MSVTTNKFRILGSSNLNGSTKCASYGNDVLMIDTSGVGIYLGNDTSKPTLIADNGEGKYLKNSGGTLAGSVTPGSNNTYSLGTSNLKWSNVYATTFTGKLIGNATSADSVPELTEAEIAEIADNSFILIAGSGGDSGMGIDDALIDESSFEEGDNE